MDLSRLGTNRCFGSVVKMSAMFNFFVVFFCDFFFFFWETKCKSIEKFCY